MKYKHIIWDWNGTILNDVGACAKAVSDIFEKRGLGTLTAEAYGQKIVFPTINLYYEAGFDFKKESFEAISEEYIGNYIKNNDMIALQEDVADVLERFRGKGLTQHIVSASGAEILNRQVEEYGLKPFFMCIFGHENNQAESKVSLAEKLIATIGCNPSEVLFIGDTVHDYEVAKEVGFDIALVSNGHCNEERLKETGAKVYKNLSTLYKSL